MPNKTIRYIQSLTGPAVSKNVGDIETITDTVADALIAAGQAELFDPPKVSDYPKEVEDTGVGSTCDFGATSVARTFDATQLIGAVGGANPSLTGKIQESTNGSAWTDVTGAVFTAVTATASNNSQRIRFTSSKRYLRHARTVSGISPTFLYSGSIQEVGK